MKIERSRPTIFQLTLHAYELSALVAAARRVTGGAEGERSDEALEQLRQVVDNYDAEMARLESG